MKLTKKSGNETIFFLDTEYCLTIKSQSTANRQGMEIEVESSFGDYKEVASVMMAHSMTQTVSAPAGSQVISFTFDKIEPNIDLSADRFAMPETEEPAVKEGE